MNKLSRPFLVVIAVTCVALIQTDDVFAWVVNKGQCRQNLVLTPGSSLRFGNVINSGGGSITVQPAISPSPSYSMVTPASGSVSAASFAGSEPGANTPGETTGCPTLAVEVDVSGGVTLTGPGGATMTATLTDSVTQSGTGFWNFYTTDLYVGGTLTVNAGQIGGSYSGTFSITVNYP